MSFPFDNTNRGVVAVTEDIDPLAVELTNELNDLEDQEDPDNSWAHQQLAQVRIKVFKGHTNRVGSCQFICNDKKVLTSSHDCTIKIWDAFNRNVLRSYNDGHTILITAARANMQNNRFVSVGWDKKVNMWDIETGQIIWSGSHLGSVTCCQFSHDGTIVATGSDLDNCVRIWDADSGELIHDIQDSHTSTITSCLFAPNDDRIITTSMDKSTVFWDLKSCKQTLSLEGHINVVSCCDITADERKFATASWDKTIQIWDISTGMYRSQGPTTLAHGHDGSISSCQFSKDGAMIVTGSYDTNIVVWDVENNIQKLKLQGHSDWIEDVCFSDDQRWLLSCSKDTTVRMWNIEETDNIPAVIENRKSIGLKIFKCIKCGKPFSIAQLESSSDIVQCVFCRLNGYRGDQAIMHS